MSHSEDIKQREIFQFKFVEPSEHEKVLDFLEEYLYTCMEPIGYSKKYPGDWRNLFRAMMENGSNLSYIAVHKESGEIAACRMVDLVVQDESHESVTFKHKTNVDIVLLCAEICQNEDLFEKYGITEYADMFGLAVHPKFRGMGIATKMYDWGLKFLKQKGFKVVKCGFISPYSRKAGLKNGYKEFARRYFHQCTDSNGNILNPASDPNEFICFGVFML